MARAPQKRPVLMPQVQSVVAGLGSAWGARAEADARPIARERMKERRVSLTIMVQDREVESLYAKSIILVCLENVEALRFRLNDVFF